MRRTAHKFNAKPTLRAWNDGSVMRFDSKKEARYFDVLQSAQRAGDVVFFLRQVPFHLPGNVRYVVDFVEFWKDGSVRFVDVKGKKTEAYIRSKKQVEALYPVEIIEA